MDTSAYVRPSREAALDLVRAPDLPALMRRASALRDAGFGRAVSYSRKVFIPLTKLCRDVCHYCTFAQPPRPGERAYLTLDEVVDVARRGAAAGCREALFTLGDKPELRYPAGPRRAGRVGIPHHDCVSGGRRESGVRRHRPAAARQSRGRHAGRAARAARSVPVAGADAGKSISRRLLEPGQAHHGSPDKDPDARLETIRLAGELAIPYTSGILIGIGETREERIASLLVLRDLHDEHGHICRRSSSRTSGRSRTRGWPTRPTRRSRTCSGRSPARGSSSVPTWRSRPRPT